MVRTKHEEMEHVTAFQQKEFAHPLMNSRLGPVASRNAASGTILDRPLR